MSQRLRALLPLLVVSALLATACTGGGQPASPQAGAGAPAAGGGSSPPKAPAKTTLTVGLSGEAVMLDPQKSTDRLTNILLTNIFDSLTVRDQSMVLQPGLAESWQSVNDTTWQFKLRRGVKFHNGEEFNADSVKFTVERFLDPNIKSPMLANVNTIRKVEIVDPLTVNIVTKGPDVLLPVRMSELYGVMLPPKYLKEKGDAEFARNPVGTGPFKFVDWVKNERLVLDAYDGYWRGAPAIKKLIFRPILEASARVAALQRGEVDFINNVPVNRADELKRDGKLLIKPKGTARVFFITLDTTKPPFNDKRVRQALNYGIDVQSIVKGVFFGSGTRVATFNVPQAFGFDASVQPYPYDSAKAKQLLADAGYGNGLSVEFDSFTGSIVDHSKLAEAIAGQLEQIGVKTKLNVSEFGVFGPRRVANKTAPMYIYSYGNWALDTAAVATLLAQGKSGYYYKDARLDALIAEANRTFDAARRKALAGEIQKHFKDEAPYVYLFQHQTVWGHSQALDFEPREDEIIWFYPAKFKS